jgi:2-dehydropantoate 2-reductase
VRVLVLGAGAVGGYFGARLAEGGHDVTLVARGRNLEALRRDGLVVQLPDGTRRLSGVRAVDDPSHAPPPELALVCVKSYDTPAAASALRAAVRPDTIVLSLQNGVENEAVLARALELPPLLVGLTFIGVELVAPGTVHYTGRGEILFGEPDGSESPRVRRLAEIFTSARVPFQLRDDILVVAWEKLAWNAGFNAVTTLTGRTVGEVLAQPATRDLIATTMIETDAVATTLGIPVRRDRLARVLAESAAEMPDFATSMLQDLRRGRRLEHDALNGAVVRAAARVGVAVPLNRTVLALLARLDRGARAGG